MRSVPQAGNRRYSHELTCSIHAGVTETVNKHPIHTTFGCLLYLVNDVVGGKNFIVMRFDGSGSPVQVHHIDLGIGSLELGCFLEYLLVEQITYNRRNDSYLHTVHSFNQKPRPSQAGAFFGQDS